MGRRNSMGQSLLGGPPVGNSPDLERVLRLPRRARVEDGTPEAQEVIATVTNWFRRDLSPAHMVLADAIEQGVPKQTLADLRAEVAGLKLCECASMGRPCIVTLRLVQAWALLEIQTERGLFGSIGTGFGKSAIDLLAPLALEGCKTALLLVPPNLVSQLINQYRHLAQHFRVPSLRVHGSTAWRCDVTTENVPTLHVMPYSRLSQADSSTWIENLAPDFVIADEVQNLKDMSAARTKRFVRYMVAASERAERGEGNRVSFACWSGSVTDDSIMNYLHLLAIALHENSPLPTDPDEGEEWARAIDPSSWPAPAGALDRFCNADEHVQEGYYRRLVETAGVVTTLEPSADCKLEITDRELEVPEELAAIMEKVRLTKIRPDGMEEFEDQIALWRCLHQLGCGFYLFWRFPRGETEEVRDVWIERRKNYNREVRDVLEQNRPNMDSPLLCARAAQRFMDGEPDSYAAPTWDSLYFAPWVEVADTVRPETDVEWLSDFVIRDVERWLDEGPPGIIWYESTELGERIASELGIPLHDGGPTAGDRIDAERGETSIVCSIRSHGTGRDGLQYKFARQRFLQPFSSSIGWEQALSRIARVGQEHDVLTEVPAHTKEFAKSLEQAISRATYVQRTTGVRQKLLGADDDMKRKLSTMARGR